MLSKTYESTEVDRRTWLHVPSGNHWSTSSDTHQVKYTKMVKYKQKSINFAYIKHDDFVFSIVNFPRLSGDFPRLPSYGVYILSFNFQFKNLQII